MSSVPFQIYIESDGLRNTQFYIAGTGTCYIKWKTGDIVTVPLSSTARSEFRNVGVYSGIIEIYMTDSTSKITSFQTAGYNGSLYFKGVVNFGTQIENINLYGCANIAYVPNSIPSTLTNLSNLFNSKYDIAGQPVYNSIFADASNSLASWDVSNVTNMSGMFVNAINFNRNISSWNTRKVTDFSYMFNGATSFNNGSAPLTWSLSDVSAINMSFMFQGASSFNQDLSWNTINVTNMDAMFYNAIAFNGNISNWDTRNVTSMSSMLGSGGSTMNFNKDVSNWKTGNVTNMTNMFLRANSFNNGNISGVSGPFNWDVSKVISMTNLFLNCQSFNRDVSSWQPSKATNMAGMFYNASVFNQNLSGWRLDVSNVIDFSNMFNGATSFNNGQPYYTTNTAPLNWTLRTDVDVSLNNMFENTPFSQDISTWNIRRVTTMANMFTPTSGKECGMTSVLFDKMLKSWSQQTGRISNVPFSTIKYTTDASSALNTLKTDSSWNITANSISYTPTSVNYGASFTLSYDSSGSSTTTPNRGYSLVNNNNPTVAISRFSTPNTQNTYTFPGVVLTDYNYSTLLLIDNSVNSIVDILYINTIFPCFKEGTKILTNNGYIPIEDLRNGDMVKTHIHGYKPIHMIGKRVIYNHARYEREKHQLYKCTSDRFPEVFEDLVITGCHCILVPDFTGPEQRAKSLQVNGDIFITDDKYRLPACVDDRTLVYEEVGPTLIYHVALENDNYFHNYGVYANGLLVETCSKRYLKELSHMDIVN
jgi:surface protein